MDVLSCKETQKIQENQKIPETEEMPQTQEIPQVEQMNALDTNDSNKNDQKPVSKPKVKKYKSIMDDLMKPPPKEEKPNIHLGGGVFKKLDKI
jgi:hypothetical protein